MKIFLLGFRWLSVLLGLALTVAIPNEFLYPHLGSLPPLFTALILLLVEGALSTVAFRNVSALGLIFIDIVLGAALSAAYGMGFFLLAGVLPVVEATYYFGSFAAFLVGITTGICTIGAGIYHIFILMGQSNKDSVLIGSIALSLGHQMLSAVVFTVLLAWVTSGIKQDEGTLAKQEQDAKQKEYELLRNIDASHTESREALQKLSQHIERIGTLETELEETKDELEGVHKELHEKKAQVQAMQQMAQKKEQQQLQVHKREVEELKAEIDLLHHHLDRVTILVEITRELHRSIHLDETFLAVLTGALKLVRSQTGILFILDESQSPPELFPEAAAGPYQTFFTNYSFKLGEGVPGWVAARLQPVRIDNETALIEGEQLASLVSYERSAMIVPLADGERTLGVLYLGRPEANSFTDEEVEDLIEFCKHASRSISNAADFHRAVTQGILDDITGLYNQMYFSERLREEEKRSKRYRYNVTLMLLDIDNFTDYNNSFGHDRGNMLLKEMGEILHEHTRETDVAARLQNDEFGVLLVESDWNNAIMIGERIRMALEMRYMARTAKGRTISVSLGMASMPKDTKDAAELYQLAEVALLNAKKNGGNKSAWAS